MTAKKTPSKKKTASKKATAKPKLEAKPKEDLVVFALRMTKAEREALHKMAGPRGATRLARTVLVATANEDETAFKKALEEAREARQ